MYSVCDLRNLYHLVITMIWKFLYNSVPLCYIHLQHITPIFCDTSYNSVFLFLFNVRHQIVTLCNTICHLGVFVFLYSSDLKVELMVFLSLIAALDHCSFASLKASLVSLDYITIYLSFCEFIFCH